MNGFFVWMILGIIAYLILFRRGDIGCCRGHRENLPLRGREYDQNFKGNIIDLDKSQFTVQTRIAGSGENGRQK